LPVARFGQIKQRNHHPGAARPSDAAEQAGIAYTIDTTVTCPVPIGFLFFGGIEGTNRAGQGNPLFPWGWSIYAKTAGNKPYRYSINCKIYIKSIYCSIV